MLFFSVFPRRLNFICQSFGTLCLFHLHRPMKMEQIECSETSLNTAKTWFTQFSTKNSSLRNLNITHNDKIISYTPI